MQYLVHIKKEYYYEAIIEADNEEQADAYAYELPVEDWKEFSSDCEVIYVEELGKVEGE